MPLRKLLLRLMMWSLAVAAVLGAAAILFNGSTVIWRISGTTAITAAAAAALMIASLQLDRPHGRAAGLLAMGATLVAALFALLLTWNLQDVLPTQHPGETAAFTIAFVILCMLPANVFLLWRHAPAARIACDVGLFLTVATFVLLMVPSWFFARAWGGGTGDWYQTAAVTASLGILAVACLVAIGSPRDTIARLLLLAVRCAGTGAAATAFAMATYGIWMHLHQGSDLFIVLVSVAAVIAHANLCLLAPLSSSQRWIRIGTIAAAVVAAVGFDWGAIDYKSSPPPDMLVRLSGAAAFVAACGSLALIILARINRQGYVAPREYREATQLTLICPGCRTKHTLPVGDAQCPTCRLKFHIRVEEPRCSQCDYLLFMLTSDRCPECGQVLS